MRQVQELLSEAEKEFTTADHLANVSYPVLRENKILLSVASHLFSSGNSCIDAVLLHQRQLKKISFIPIDFETKLKLFQMEILNKTKFDRRIIPVMKELHSILKQHQESPIEFSRKGTFVICNDDYSLVKSINMEIIKVYIEVLRIFITTFREGLRQNV